MADKAKMDEPARNDFHASARARAPHPGVKHAPLSHENLFREIAKLRSCEVSGFARRVKNLIERREKLA